MQRTLAAELSMSDYGRSATRMHRTVLLSAVALLLAGASSADRAAGTQLPDGTIQIPFGAGRWVSGSATLPPGAELMLLEGDPTQKGMFTIRLRLPAGSRLAPHWHPRDERVTVLSGEVRIGFGDRFDADSMTSFEAGSFYVNPARSHHFVDVPRDSTLQVTGLGPWELHYLDAR